MAEQGVLETIARSADGGKVGYGHVYKITEIGIESLEDDEDRDSTGDSAKAQRGGRSLFKIITGSKVRYYSSDENNKYRSVSCSGAWFE